MICFELLVNETNSIRNDCCNQLFLVKLFAVLFNLQERLEERLSFALKPIRNKAIVKTSSFATFEENKQIGAYRDYINDAFSCWKS